MRRTPVAIFYLTVLPFLAVQSSSSQDTSPIVWISLPPDIPSETVQIHYFMTGPFGGFGGSMKPQRNLHSYPIPGAAEGKDATAIKVLVYAAGCEIQTFDVSFSQERNFHEHFVCRGLPMVTLSGQVPSDLVRDRDAELVITYMALWAHEFFGITDGFVVELQIATVVLDKNGIFTLRVPDFSADASASSFRRGANLHLLLRDSKTLNTIAYNLAPESQDLRSESQRLKILPFYPDDLRFTDQLP